MNRRGRMRSQEFPRQRRSGPFSVVAGIAGVACLSLALLVPANAQFWGGWGSPQPQSQPARPQPARPSQQYQQYNPFQGVFGGSQQQQQPQQQQRGGEIQLDFSIAPKPQKRPDPGAATTVVVVGDAMADWLAYGLEDAFAERPEFS